MSDLTGQHLGKYYIVNRIGEGGMAEVYQAYHERLSRYVAIKVIHSRLAERADLIDRFEQEATVVAQFRHPNIVQVHDFDLLDNMYYLVMEFIQGPTLETELKERQARQKPFNLEEISHIVIDLAGAVDYAHKAGIVHRDLKPANVMFTPDGQVVLTDFGVALLQGAGDAVDDNIVVGTPAYMSPEQAQGDQTDHRSDIYSLGIILFEMITGRLPFQADNPSTMLMKQIMEPVPAPTSLNASIPKDIEAIILRALNKDPAARFQSAAEMAQALQSSAGQMGALRSDAAPSPIVAIAHKTIFPNETGIFGSPGFIPHPPTPMRPPDIGEFVGREEELAYFAHRLNDDHLAVISGMAGVGKTALATRLAQQTTEPDHIFWYTFREGEGVQAVLWQLAGFLAWRGQDALWTMLQNVRRSDSKPPPPETLLDYLLQMIGGHGYVFCFDDFHHIQSDPLLDLLFTRLQTAVSAGEVTLIITSRRTPALARLLRFDALEGLSYADTAHLMDQRGLSLSDDQIEQLYTHTQGNAEFLTLAVNALQRARRPGRLIARLAETSDMEDYLLAEVDDGLSEDEREVMAAASILMGYPGTRDAISAVLEGLPIRRTLRDLRDSHLLIANEGPQGLEYSLHSIVQAFYYDSLGRRERQEMHLLAAEFYELDEPDTLKAARHYEQAAEFEKSVQLATSDVWALINQGQAQALRHLLETFRPRQMDLEYWINVNLASGQVYNLLGEREEAKESYGEALSQINSEPDRPSVRKLSARAFQGMGELLEPTAPQEALNWLQRGLEIAADDDVLVRAAMNLTIGNVQMNMGNYEAALAALEQGFADLPETATQLRCNGLMNFGGVYFFLGDVERAKEYTLRALEISQQMHDHFRTVDLLSNLGAYRFTACEWQAAIEDWQRALSLAEQLGSEIQKCSSEANLGMAYIYTGDDEAALNHLNNALSLIQKNNLPYFESNVQHCLADLRIRSEDWHGAVLPLREAERLALEIDARGELPQIYGAWAEVMLGTGRPQEALERSKQATELARELGMTLEEGKCQRILAQSLLANGQVIEGMKVFEQSLALLQAEDPYEAARTRMYWGLALLAESDSKAGSPLLKEAYDTFQTLGAKRDLAYIAHHWPHHNP